MIPRHCFPLIHSSSVLKLADASKESLQDICDASNVAGVGLGNRNIFDETYRQSKTLDTSQSFCNFDPRASEILDEVQADLVEGHDEIQKVLPLELYRLNVGSEGDFQGSQGHH